MYLIDNGYLLIINIKKEVSQNILKNLFGVENLSFLTIVINMDNVFGKMIAMNLRKESKIY